MPRLVVELDVKRYDWYPRTLQDIATQVGGIVETGVAVSELRIVGTNKLDRTNLSTDEDLVSWLESTEKAQVELEEHDYDDRLHKYRLLKVHCPPRVLATTFKPGEAPILAKGTRTGAFNGDGKADGRHVDFAVRFFDCGHFYMKQSMPCSPGLPPQWVIFEGRWTRSIRGYRLETFFRYGRTTPNCIELVIHGYTGHNSSSLNFSGEEEKLLKGFLPATVSRDSSCWVALTKNEIKPKALYQSMDQEEDDDDEEESEEEETFSQDQKTELVQSLMRELKPEQQTELRHALGEHGMNPAMYGQLSKPVRNALQRLQRRATFTARRMQHAGESEPTWPLYLGLALFVFVFLVFAYMWYDENYGNVALNDIDEDDYWKTDSFL